jgi:ketosteroid isomerase-like protein
MSQENVELMRRLFAVYGEGTLMLERLDPEVICHPADEVEMKGTDAVADYMKRWEQGWDDLKTVAEEFIDCGDQVLVTVHFSGRGRETGIAVDQRAYEVYTLRDGLITRWDEFTDRAAAFAAAGLSG